MEFSLFMELLNRKKQTIALVTMVFVFFGVIFTFIQPLKYMSESKVLVMQALPEGVDPYQVSRSNEHVASLLTQIISTNSFYNEVLNSGFNINKSYFPESSSKKMKLWKKTVSAYSDANGIITVRVYHSNRVQVNEISDAVDFVLETKHEMYHGFGKTVSVKVIQEPVTSDLPVKPNIFINMLVAFFFGLLVSMTYVYLFPEKRFGFERVLDGRGGLPSGGFIPQSEGLREKEAGMEFVYADNEETPIAVKPIMKEEVRESAAKEKKPIVPPKGLPFIDEEDDEAIPSQSAEPRQIKGSMQNIINQADHRG